MGIRDNMGIIIEPVASRHRMKAVCFLVAGTSHDTVAQTKAQLVYNQIQWGNWPWHLWWARNWTHCFAAALLFESPGRTGMLMLSPPDAPGVQAGPLADLAAALSGHGLGGGLSMVQALLEQDEVQAVGVLSQAGFRPLAKLIYMRMKIPGPPFQAPPAGVTLIPFEQVGVETLAKVILSTYQHSLDCAALEGVRRIEDIIEGHKHSGLYRPHSWWIACVNDQLAGCVLVNDSSSGEAAEIVYLGVSEPFRGRGLGKTMIRYAACDAWRRDIFALTLAVDAANVYALQLYRAMGFTEVNKKLAYMIAGAKEEKRSQP